MSVNAIEDDSQFPTELAAAGIKLVVVDYHATWCGPCQRIAPLYALLPNKYPKAIFLKVDVDKCPETASSQGVSVMPTFIFYRNRTKIDRIQGADMVLLEAKIKQHIGSTEDESGEDYGPGLMDINTFIAKSECECLNEADEHPLAHCLTNSGGFLQSDVDEQLILSIAFNQAVKIHSLKLKAPEKLAPKTIKLFINQPRTMDFDQAENSTSVQDIVVSPKDLESGIVNLRFVKFQNIQNIQLFIKDNQSKSEVTQIDYLGFIGAPISTTKMDDFKRVAGKKGESH